MNGLLDRASPVSNGSANVFARPVAVDHSPCFSRWVLVSEQVGQPMRSDVVKACEEWVNGIVEKKS